MKGKRFLKRFFILLFAVAALAVAVAAAGWLWSFRLPVQNVPERAELTPSTDVQPGETVTAAFHLLLPRSCRIAEVQTDPGEPVVPTAPPQLTVEKRFWRTNLVAVTLPVTALRPGETKPGKIIFTVQRHFNKPLEKSLFTVTIPSFMAVTKLLPQGGAALELADALPEPQLPLYRRHPWRFATGAAVLLALLAALLYFLRRKVHERRRIPPWESALQQLRELRFLVMQKRLAAEAGIVQLTDLVRIYLEKRYGLPATTATTREFLSALDRDRSDRLLPAAQKPFLREFLQAADLVRFARAAADREMVDRAIAQAENLVESTIPSEEEGKGEK